MNFFKKISVFSVIVFAFSAFAANPPAPAQKKLVDKIVAVVNQEIILNSDYETMRKGMEEAFKKGPEKAALDKPEIFQKKVLQQMIEDKLVEQQVRSLGLETTDAQLESVVANIMKSNNLQTRRDLERALRTEGVTYDEFTSEYRKRIGKNNLVNQIIAPKIKISDDEIETEYKKRTKTTGQEMQYLLSMIFISKANTTQKQMEKLRKSIASVTDFAKNADDLTEGPGKGSGGTMGWVDPADLQSPLNDTAKKMKKGNISQLLQTENGYYILACIDTKSKASDEEIKIKNEIREEMMNTLITKNLNQYILDLKQKAHIETFL